MRVLCYHGRYHINPENSTHVKDGVPLCNAATCQQVLAHRQARDLRRVPHADVEFDDVPEPYAKSVYARCTDV